MADEFQGGICGGSWWNSSRSAFMSGSSPCSVGATSDMGYGTYGSWMMTDAAELKPRSCKESVIDSVSESSVIFQDSQKSQLQANSDSGGSSILIDSTLEMMGFGLSSSSTSSDWNQVLISGNGRAENSYNSVLQQKGMNASQIQKDWSPKCFTSTSDDSSVNAFKSINQDFSLDQQRLSPMTRYANSIPACQRLSSTGFSASTSYGFPSSLVQCLFEPDHPHPQQQLFNNRSINYATNLNELSTSWAKISPFMKSSLPKEEHSNILQFSNNTPFCNVLATPIADVKASFMPSLHTHFLAPTLEEKSNCPNMKKRAKSCEEIKGSGSMVKRGSEPAFKKPRTETPSPLPTFKVRKEKLGDRITALQQLVSPFGKTDTASVLQEAIDYIKFLHDQVNVLSTPYMKNGKPIQHQQDFDNNMEFEGPKQDLRSRGLCLVPISSTFPVAHETTADFWTPTFGATFR
ncbi:hypothetical protein K2173_004581 [Erythroxylum novogranatense]|uniref:BHLH domain-containing protein n=1 Tax=Erythroxylum novogranatense TaxID=1862640 RepID=A0AAV8T4R9_9ROSI|nr:hypothetical protein K2173_004581 [Erythroxylum novogranatense]